MEPLKKLELLDAAIRAKSFPLASVAIYSEIIDRIEELGATPELDVRSFISLGEKDDCVEKRIDRLAKSGVIDVERKPLRVVWCYHPIPEKRQPRERPMPLFEGIEEPDDTLADDKFEAVASVEPVLEPAKIADLASDKLSDKIYDNLSDNLSPGKNLPSDPNILTRVCAGAGGRYLSQIKERKKEANFEIAFEEDRRRVVEHLVAPNDWSVASELIDRVTLGRRQNVAGLDDANLKRIRQTANESVRLYERTDGALGKRFRWLVIASEVGNRFKAAGLAWESFGPSPTPEPPPLAESERREIEISQSRKKVPTLSELIRQSRGAEVPAGEPLEATAQRLGITIPEALGVRSALKKLAKLQEA